MAETPQRSIRLSDEDWELLKKRGGSKFIQKALKNDEETRIEKIRKHLNSVIWALKNVDNPDIDRAIDVLECILDL